MYQKNSKKNPQIGYEKVKSKKQRLKILAYRCALLKALKPLEQAGVVFIPTVIDRDRDHTGTFLALKIAFANIDHRKEGVIVHFTGHEDGFKDTLTIVLEF